MVLVIETFYVEIVFPFWCLSRIKFIWSFEKKKVASIAFQNACARQLVYSEYSNNFFQKRLKLIHSTSALCCIEWMRVWVLDMCFIMLQWVCVILEFSVSLPVISPFLRDRQCLIWLLPTTTLHSLLNLSDFNFYLWNKNVVKRKNIQFVRI